MVQTPRQRQGNEIYAIREAAKRGKSKTEKPLLKKLKPNISIYWVYLLIFLVIGGAVLETFYMLFFQM